VAYFIDKEILEFATYFTNRVARLRIGLGVFRWSPDESRILLKRSSKNPAISSGSISSAAPIANHEISIPSPRHSHPSRSLPAISPSSEAAPYRGHTRQTQSPLFPLPR